MRALRSSGVQIGRAVERRAHGVIDRAQEAGHVAGGRSLAAPLLEAAPRLAFEIEEVHVILGDQDLAKMEVAMVADLLPSRCTGVPIALKHRMPLGEQSVRQ